MAVDVAMQQRNPTFRHRRTDSGQKELSNRFQPEYLQPVTLNTLRKRTTRSHRSSKAWEVHSAKRAVDVAMQQRNQTFRHRRSDSGQKELSNRFQPEYIQPVMLYILRKRTALRGLGDSRTPFVRLAAAKLKGGERRGCRQKRMGGRRKGAAERRHYYSGVGSDSLPRLVWIHFI